MDEDTKWEFDAPQHYCDLPSAITDDDSELADQYFFTKTDDTVYFEPNTDDTFQEIGNKEVNHTGGDKDEFPVIRRRSLSVGSRPLNSLNYEISSHGHTFRKPLPPKSNRNVEDSDHHFVGGLRAYNLPKASGYEAPKVTKPIPFNLSVPKKKIVKTESENPSMAEGVRRWEKKTPERFHTTRHGETFRFTERVEMRPTEPHTPQLSAVKRHRPIHVLSREELEKREVEEMKKNQFKAHTIDEKIFKPPKLPIKKELKATKVEPFHLTESFKKENIPPSELEERDFQFHAKPAPKFEAPASSERKPLQVTVPQTPKFSEAGKASLQQWRRQRSQSNESGTMSTRSGSFNGSLNSCGTERVKNTVIEPFSFEDRDKMLQRKKEIKIRKIIEEEKKQREFHANPCPNFSHPVMPERPTFSATRPAPFHLSCETRGQSKKEKFLQQLEELRIEERKASQFKAQPARILNREPFKVKQEHGRNNLTHAVEFSLSTEKRAVERKTFEQFLKEREQEKEANRIRREQERLKHEAEIVAKEREKATFHAHPIRQYKTIDIKKADLDLLTVPKTPKFMKKSA